MNRRRQQPAPIDRTAFTGYRFPSEVIMLAVRWYLRDGLFYRDVEELLAERGHPEPRRGHYELGTDTRHSHLRIRTAFEELSSTI